MVLKNVGYLPVCTLHKVHCIESNGFISIGAFVPTRLMYTQLNVYTLEGFFHMHLIALKHKT